MFQPPLDESSFEITFSVEQPREPFASHPSPYSNDFSATSGIYPGQTFDNAGAIFGNDSYSSSVFCSPVMRGLGVPFGDYDANSTSSRELSPASPGSSPGTFLEPPPTRNFGRRKSSSSAEFSTSFLHDLRRYPSSLSLSDNYQQQPITDISQNVRKMSLGIETTRIFETSKSDLMPAFFTNGPSPSYGVSTSSLIVQTQVPGDSSPWTTPTPSPVSPNTPPLPVDGMSWKDRPKRTKSRSKKDKEASLRRRKTQGPGEYVCDVCGDDFTAMHRLQGHKESKHDGVKFRCDACNSELSHRTSYDRHVKKTCPIRHPRDAGK